MTKVTLDDINKDLTLTHDDILILNDEIEDLNEPDEKLTKIEFTYIYNLIVGLPKETDFSKLLNNLREIVDFGQDWLLEGIIDYS